LGALVVLDRGWSGWSCAKKGLEGKRRMRSTNEGKRIERGINHYGKESMMCLLFL
jgi:hypothetical protein